jgi:osmotically-inducible protein OsmY
MRKSSLIGIGAAVGALLAYLFDPDRGRSRRARLSDQAAARSRDLTNTMRQTAEYQKGVAKGIIHDASEAFRPDNVYDDETLMQKVRSEALGYWDGSESIEIDITDGKVELSGSVRDSASHDQLLSLIRDVEGVGLIDDRLKVGS